jgi:hypothetical protein
VFPEGRDAIVTGISFVPLRNGPDGLVLVEEAKTEAFKTTVVGVVVDKKVDEPLRVRVPGVYGLEVVDELEVPWL